MLTALLVAVAGAAGVTARYVLSLVAPGDAGLWMTLAINLVGSFALGLLFGGAASGERARVVIGTGFLGGFTTYSTFSVQTVMLTEDGRLPLAAAYVAASVVLGVGAAAAGFALARTA